MVTIWKADTSTKRMRWERAITGRHDLEVFHAMNRWLEKAGEVSGASSTAPMAMKPNGDLLQSSPVMEMELEEGIGMGTMEEEECRGRADNSPAAAPLQPKSPHPCPSRPANGWTDNRRKGDGPHLRKPEGPEEGAHPPHPYEAPTTTSTRGGRGALPVRPATRKRSASRGTPEGQPAT